MHAIWALLLDEEFLHAYVHGIVITCADGITRRVYPRIFTYSADYPEKSVALLICIDTSTDVIASKTSSRYNSEHGTLSLPSM